MKVERRSMTCIRYMPTLRTPVFGSFVMTAGRVMNGAGSPGQHRWTGSRPRSTSSPSWKTSWQAPLETTFGSESATDFSFRSPLTFSTSPCGGCMSRTSPSFAAASSSFSTPSARHMRRSVPNWLMRSGCWAPFGFSKRSAGPPDLTTRSVISVISRSGATAAEMGRSSPSRSRSATHSRRSFGGATARVSLGGERLLHRLVERELPSHDPRLLEGVAGDGRQARLAGRTVPEPAAERRADAIVLDRAPQPAGAGRVSAIRGDAREHTHAEHPAAVVAHHLSEGERLPGARIRVVDPSCGERQGGQLDEHPRTPPHDSDLLRELGALRDQLVRAVAVPRIALQRPERPDRLGHAPHVVVPLVDLVTRLDKPPRLAELTATHRLDPEPMPESGLPVLVPERLVQREAPRVSLVCRVVLARDVGRAPVRT